MILFQIRGFSNLTKSLQTSGKEKGSSAAVTVELEMISRNGQCRSRREFRFVKRKVLDMLFQSPGNVIGFLMFRPFIEVEDHSQIGLHPCRPPAFGASSVSTKGENGGPDREGQKRNSRPAHIECTINESRAQHFWPRCVSL